MDRRAMPDSPMAYSGADIVAVSPEVLKQDFALRQWVESGGVVIVAGSPGPVTVLGLGRVVYAAPGDGTADPNAWRPILERSATGNVFFSELKKTDGYYYALDYPARGPNESKPPTAVGLASFLGLYIVMLVPANYLVLRRLRRKELAWITIPALVAVFSLAAYLIGSAGMGKTLTVRRVNIAVTSAESQVASVTGQVRIFSPSRRRYDIRFSGAPMFAGDIRDYSDRSPFPALEVVEDRDSVCLPQADIYMWSTRRFALSGISDLGGRVSARFTTNGKEIRGTIRNELPFELKDCVLCGDRVSENIGDLKPGRTVSIARPLRDTWFRSPRAWRKPAGQLSANELLESSLIRPRLISGSAPGEMTLLGWTRNPPFEMTIDGRTPASEEASALIVRIRPEWRPDASGRVSWSMAPESAQGDGYSGMYSYYRRRGGPRVAEITVDLQKDGTVLRYRLPVDQAQLDIRALSLSCGVFPSSASDTENPTERGNLPGVVRVEAYDYRAAAWSPIGETKSYGPLVLRVLNPRNAIGPGGDVRIKFSRKPAVAISVRAPRLTFEGRLR